MKTIIYPEVLNRDGMNEFLDLNRCRNGGGRLDLNEIKEISGFSHDGNWKLVSLSTGISELIVEPRKKRNRLPIIAGYLGDNEWNVMDGRHRIGAARWQDEPYIQAYVASFDAIPIPEKFFKVQ